MGDNNWRIEHLEETQGDHAKRLGELEQFQSSTIEKLKTIFKRLQDIEETNKWVSKTFFFTIFSGAVTAIFSLVVWLLQR